MTSEQPQPTLGWIGVGRMGVEMARRLLDAGQPLRVYNRTRSKAAPLVALGAEQVDAPSDLADCDLVFTMVAASQDLLDVVLGERGLLGAEVAPTVIVDSSTVSVEASAEVRARAAERGTSLLAAPVSGNPRVVAAGQLGMVVSGPGDAFAQARPYLELIAARVTYVGADDRARLVKICHNLMLGAINHALSEVTVLAEKAGIRRADLLEFINASVVGSTFTRYKTPALVSLDFTTTFTPALLRKDFDLGLTAAAELGVPMPLAALVRETLQALVGHGYVDVDFAALLELQAKASGCTLAPEDVAVSDGLA